MHSTFLNRWFDWGQPGAERWITRINQGLRRLHSPWGLCPLVDPSRDMTNIEQRINLWHLASQPLAYNVPGDLVELGCFDGKTATIFAQVMMQWGNDRQLHLYDHFQMSFSLTGRDIQQEVIKNFQAVGCSPPIIHNGDFAATVPAELPEQIAFVHIDCGYGGDVEMHRATVLFLLEQVYPRMSPGAIGVLMDYYDPTLCSGSNFNPGVGLAAQDFFADKPEKVGVLWAKEYTHGYFRRALLQE